MKTYLAAVAAVVLAANADMANAEPVLVNGESCKVSTLVAGQHMAAGTVTVCEGGTILFEADAGWLITETHLEVASSPGAIPQKNGNPRPGQFTYKREYDPPVMSDSYEVGPLSGTNYIAAHAAMLELQEACIDFEQFEEKDRVNYVDTDNGPVVFSMVESGSLVALNVGDPATFITGAYPNDVPIVATPDTTPPQENIVAFTFNDSPSDPFRDDYIDDAQGTDAGGNTLTDPQDGDQIPLLRHAFAQGLAISADFSLVPGLWGVSVNGIDLDFNERWQFQFFNASGELLQQQEVVGIDQSGDGAAFPVSYQDSRVTRMVVWGGNNLGVADRIGFALDNVCSVTASDETAWGAGTDFAGRNWATYIEYTVPPPS